MSEESKLKEARRLVYANENEKAKPLLLELYGSKNPAIRLDAILILITILNHLTENDKLIEIANTGIEIASSLGKEGVRILLLAKKSVFLLLMLGFLISRQRNLTLAAGVFKWIDFSLERDKKEFEAILAKRKQLEKEIKDLEVSILESLELNIGHYLRGHILAILGDFYSSKFFNNQMDLMIGGRIKSKIGNIYLIRRWNLDKYILYNKKGRKEIKEVKDKCIYFFKKAIAEFEAGNMGGDMAHACYNLAVKFKLMYNFNEAKKFLDKARSLAETNNEKIVLNQIDLFQKELFDKNRHPRNYIEELGLDLP